MMQVELCDLQEVKSSNIKAIGLLNEKEDIGDLIVEYVGGSQYMYKGVPKKLYEGLLAAESKGSYMNAEVKGKYDYTKLKNKEEETL